MRVFIVGIVLFFLGCSYEPSSHYIKKAIGDKIYTEVRISVKDPESMPLITDALNEAIISKFRSHLTKNKDEASAVIVIRNVAFYTTGLQKDKNGYTILFRTTAVLNVTVQIKDKEEHFRLLGNYDFAQTSDSVLSEEKKLTSYKLAVIKALDSLTVRLAYIKKLN